MQNVKKRIETWLEQLTSLIYTHPYTTLVIMMAWVALFAFKAATIHSDTSLEGLLHKDDPILIDYNAFRDQFGREELIVVGIKTPDLFDLKFLERLRSLHNDLQAKVPLTEKIQSLINARVVSGSQDAIIVGDLFDPWPDSPEAVAAIKNKVLSTPAYKNTLISEDGRYATILIQTSQFGQASQNSGDLGGLSGDDMAGIEPDVKKSPPPYLNDEENSLIVKSVTEITKKYEAPDFNIFISGSPSVTHALKIALFRDMTLFTTISILSIAIILFFMFRRVTGVILPLLVVNFALISTFGVMAFSGAVVKIPFAILPSFLMTACVGGSIHVLVLFFKEFNEIGDKKKAICHAIRHCSIAIIITSVTTAAGLFSFTTAEIAPVADLGRYSAIGVILALVYALLFLPALIAIIPLVPRSVRDKEPQHRISDKVTHTLANLAIHNKWRVILFAVLLFAVSATGFPKLKFFHNVVQWFPEHDPIRVSTETIDRDLKGSISLEIVVDTGKENGIFDPHFLKKLDEEAEKLERYRSGDLFVGKAWSITTIIKEVNKALHENDEAYYTLPDTRELIAQEILLFENSGSDDLSDFTDSQFQKARLIVKVPAIDAIQYTAFITLVQDDFKKAFPGYEVKTTGMMAILFKTIHNLIISMVQSNGTALLVICFFMVVLIGHVGLALLSMIPNVLPIVVTIGVMGWIGIPMDMFSILIGNILMGIVVDDTIHLMHHYTKRRKSDQARDPEKMIRETILDTGPAMMVTNFVLAAGFFMFMFSSMNNLFNFGLLSGVTILTALLADLLITPALLAAVEKKH